MGSGCTASRPQDTIKPVEKPPPPTEPEKKPMETIVIVAGKPESKEFFFNFG